MRRKGSPMRVAVPSEIKNHEYRVAITPVGVAELVAHGHEVFVQAGAGLGSSISDAEYVAQGATILPTAEETWAAGEMVLKVKEPVAAEFGHLREDLLLFTYLHLAADRAVTDALLGAAGLGDIGRHFPDTDARFKGADSAALLAEAARRVRAAGWRIGNVDSTVVAQAPRLAAHIPAMVARIAEVLEVAAPQVNVKAKTAERMGPVGQGLAMEARAATLLFGRPAAAGAAA